MKLSILSIVLCVYIHSTFAQGNVGIGTVTPNSSAILDLTNAQNKGLLIPSMTTAQKNVLVSPAQGLMIYQLDSTKGFYFFDNLKWRRIGEGGNAWIETNNAVYTQKKVGIGVTEPQAALHSKGSFLIEGESVKGKQTGAIPEYNMPLTFTTYTDSSGVLYDDGGPNNNYTDLRNLKINVNPNGTEKGTLIEVIFMNLLTGDSLIIGDNIDSFKLSGSTLFKHLFHEAQIIKIRFKSNTSGNAAGFKLRWDAVYTKPGIVNPSVNFPSGMVYNDSLKSLIVGDLLAQKPPGSYSFAFGKNNEASGDYSVSMGEGCISRNDYAVSIGNLTSATGVNSLAMGWWSYASGAGSTSIGTYTGASGSGSTSIGTLNYAIGDQSTALGYQTNASGDLSTALGFGCYASGYASTAIGESSIASGSASTAMGNGCAATAGNTTAMGQSTKASGAVSTSLGRVTKAKGSYSCAIGNTTIANGFSSTVVGMYNDSVVAPQTSFDLSSLTPLFIVGNGDIGAPSNAFVIRKDGHVGIGTSNPKVKLNIVNGNDVGYGDSDGYAVFGFLSTTNLVMDNNEIEVRNNGAAADFFIQHDGGKVLIGTGSTDHLFDVNGTAGKPGGGSWSTYSDRRLKQNIQLYQDGLNAVLQIHPIRYHYNSISGFDTTPEYVGVIAQDLQKTAPYMVSTSQKVLDDGSTGYLEIDNSAMIYMLINAVKELNDKIEVLESHIEKSKPQGQ